MSSAGPISHDSIQLLTSTTDFVTFQARYVILFLVSVKPGMSVLAQF